MVGARAFGRHQQEDDIDRTLIDCIEIDGMSEACKQPDRLVERREPAVRNGNAATDAGGAQALTLEQAVEQTAFIYLEDAGGFAGQFGQQGLLAGRLDAGQDRVRACQQIGNFHNVTNGLAGTSQIRPARGAPL